MRYKEMTAIFLSERVFAMPAGDISRFLTAKQVAHRLHVHPVTLRRWSREKLGPAWIMIGSARFYDPLAVEAWLARQPSFTPPDAVA